MGLVSRVSLLASCFSLLPSCFLSLASCFLFLASCLLPLASCLLLLVSCFLSLASCLLLLGSEVLRLLSCASIPLIPPNNPLDVFSHDIKLQVDLIANLQIMEVGMLVGIGNDGDAEGTVF